MEEMIGRPYSYTRKSTKFRISSHFFISIYLYSRSRDRRIAYADPHRRYRPITRRRTPTIYRENPRQSELFLLISETIQTNQSFILTELSPTITDRICRPHTEPPIIIINPRKSSQCFAKPRNFELFIG